MEDGYLAVNSGCAGGRIEELESALAEKDDRIVDNHSRAEAIILAREKTIAEKDAEIKELKAEAYSWEAVARLESKLPCGHPSDYAFDVNGDGKWSKIGCVGCQLEKKDAEIEARDKLIIRHTLHNCSIDFLKGENKCLKDEIKSLEEKKDKAKAKIEELKSELEGCLSK